MSVRYFCDGCGRELREEDGGRLRRRLGRISVEVMTALDGTWNGGQICHACVTKAVTEGESDAR